MNILRKLTSGLIILAVLFNANLATVSALSADESSQINESTTAAVDYQESQQQADGSLGGFGGETEWQVIANVAYEQSTDQKLTSTDELVNSLKDDVLDSSTTTTEVEKKILAIEAAGQDSSNFGGKDYKTELTNRHNNQQLGETALLNDDYFGLMAINSMKATDMSTVASDSLNYIIANQGSDGGFAYGVGCAYCTSDSNDTAAAILALYAAQDLGLTHANLSTCRESAINYLLSTQKADGGFGYDVYSDADGSSTAWSLMALNRIGTSVATQATAARAWLLSNQNPDGGFAYGLWGITNSDTYTTAHSMIALLGTSWDLAPAPFVLVVQPTVSPITQTNSSAPSARAQARNSGSQTVSAVSAGMATSLTPVSVTSVSEQVGATNHIPDQSNKKLNSSNNNDNLNMQIFGILGLILAAGMWFVLTKRSSKEEENK